MKRLLLLGGALLFFVWSNVATGRWLAEFPSVGAALHHFGAAVTADWMLLLILTDAAIFTLFSLAWLWTDLRRRAVPPGRAWSWLIAAIILGCPGLLVYLAFRPAGLAEAPR